MPAPGGYQVTPGLYRVPDLLTEEQLVDYMKSTYGRTIEFTDTENSINPARALGRTIPMGVLHEGDEGGDGKNTPRHPDPILKKLNELDFGPAHGDVDIEDKTTLDERTRQEQTDSKKTTPTTTTTKTQRK